MKNKNNEMPKEWTRSMKILLIYLIFSIVTLATNYEYPNLFINILVIVGALNLCKMNMPKLRKFTIESRLKIMPIILTAYGPFANILNMWTSPTVDSPVSFSDAFFSGDTIVSFVGVLLMLAIVKDKGFLSLSTLINKKKEKEINDKILNAFDSEEPDEIVDNVKLLLVSTAEEILRIGDIDQRWLPVIDDIIDLIDEINKLKLLPSKDIRYAVTQSSTKILKVDYLAFINIYELTKDINVKNASFIDDNELSGIKTRYANTLYDMKTLITSARITEKSIIDKRDQELIEEEKLKIKNKLDMLG